ncbi:Acetolactate synthase [uncultured virus]|nr:Acetolactate synthase [uncultured virus]
MTSSARCIINDQSRFYSSTSQQVIKTSPKVVGKIILKSIISHQGGFGTIFGLCGSTTYQFDEIMQGAINKRTLQYIHCTNEITATLAAANYGKVGVVLTTRGPGITMAMTGLASAYQEKLPLVYLCGIDTIDSIDEFQYIDLNIINAVTKKAFVISNTVTSQQQIKDIMKSAFNTAIEGTDVNPGHGPVAVFVMYDMWQRVLTHASPTTYVPQNPVTGQEQNAVNEIIERWNDSSFVVMRLGSRVNRHTGLLMIKLANKFAQFYIVSAFHSRSIFSPVISSKYLSFDGRLGNSVANKAVNNADLVIEAGIGPYISSFSYPIDNNKTIQLYDEPVESPGYKVNVNKTLELLYEQSEKLQNKAAIILGNPTLAFGEILNQYLHQNNTIGYYVASCINQQYSPNFLINYDYNQIVDIGVAGLIAIQLLRCKNYNNTGFTSEFSPIGLSMGSTVGRLYDTKKDSIIYIGDGALLTMLFGLIDLAQVCKITKTRVLILLFNDQRYGDVALPEKKLFGKYTSITKTSPLYNNFDIYTLFKSLNPIKLARGYHPHIIENFLNKTYTDPGLYIMVMNGTTHPPVTTP